MWNSAVNDVAAVNASPLIFLGRSGHMDLLARFFRRVVVPRQVAEELLARGASDAAAEAIRHNEWLEVAEVELIPASIEAWGLGAGESAVIALAHAREGVEAIIDDLAGRRCALSLGIAVRGTLGLVLLAKRRGFIDAARPVLEDLIQGGMYLSRHVLDEALRRVAE